MQPEPEPTAVTGDIDAFIEALERGDFFTEWCKDRGRAQAYLDWLCSWPDPQGQEEHTALDASES